MVAIFEGYIYYCLDNQLKNEWTVYRRQVLSIFYQRKSDLEMIFDIKKIWIDFNPFKAAGWLRYMWLVSYNMPFFFEPDHWIKFISMMCISRFGAWKQQMYRWQGIIQQSHVYSGQSRIDPKFLVWVAYFHFQTIT